MIEVGKRVSKFFSGDNQTFHGVVIDIDECNCTKDCKNVIATVLWDDNLKEDYNVTELTEESK
jgi:hypothetical protein